MPLHRHPDAVVVVTASVLGGGVSDRTGRRKVVVFTAAIVYGLALLVIAISGAEAILPCKRVR